MEKFTNKLNKSQHGEVKPMGETKVEHLNFHTKKLPKRL
jgi:hypothetical protein